MANYPLDRRRKHVKAHRPMIAVTCFSYLIMPVATIHAFVPKPTMPMKKSTHVLPCRFAALDENCQDDSSPTSLDKSNNEINQDSLFEMDCFLFSRKKNSDLEDRELLELGTMEDSLLQPLVVWTLEESFDDYMEFLVDEEDRNSVHFDDVIIHSLIPVDSLSFGSRQVGGGMGPGNPHGEESEILYHIKQKELTGVKVIVKPELEIFW